MSLTPSWQQEQPGPHMPAPRKLLRVLSVLGIGGALGIFWRELFEVAVSAVSLLG